jgi:protein CpxP
MKSLRHHLLTAAVLAGLGVGAIAQTQTAPAPQTGGPRMMQGQGGNDAAGMERHRAHRQERLAKRLGVLKAQLKIAAPQEGAWTTWTTALQPTRMQRPDRAEFQRLNTPERIDRMRALRAARNADMDKRLDATKTFYASLNTEQKAVFDAVGMRYAGKGGMDRGMGGKGGHGGHHGMHHGRG